MEYGLIGEKLGHSFSRQIHASIDGYDYILKEIPKEDVASFMEKRDFKGINVTIPYKETVIPMLDEIDENVILSARNIPDVKTAQVNSINVYDILKYDSMLLTKSAVETIEEVYA